MSVIVSEITGNPVELTRMSSNLSSSVFEVTWKVTLNPGPLFTKRTDVLPQDFAKSRSREILV